MKLLTIQELRTLDDAKLSALVETAAKAYLEARMQLRQEQLKDTSLVPKYRRYKAQVKTLQRERAQERILSGLAKSVVSN